MPKAAPRPPKRPARSPVAGRPKKAGKPSPARKAPSTRTQKAATSVKARTSVKAGTASSRPPSPVSVSSDPRTLLTDIAAAVRLSPDEVLRRALHGFVAMHGLALPARNEPDAATSPTTARSAATRNQAKAPEAAASADEPPALAPDVRLYVHGIGRPPMEMVRDTFVIGSSNKCDLWVYAPKIEHRHLRIEREGDRYYMIDNDTEAGTRVGSEQLVGRREIRDREEAYLAGYHRVRFYLLGDPS